MTTILFLLVPAAIGAILAAFNASNINDATERVEAWTNRRYDAITSSSGPFAKYVVKPFLWALTKFWGWTDSIAHRGVKSGVRVATTLYLLGVWLMVLYAAIMAVLTILAIALVTYMILKMFVNSDTDIKESFDRARRTSGRNALDQDRDVLDRVGLKGQKVYSGSTWLNEELEGRVDDEGYIYRGTNWLTEERIGRIDGDGNVLRGTSFLNEETVGRIDEDGVLHRGTNWLNEEPVGRIDEHGDIYEGTNWLNEQKRGRTGS